MSSWKEILFGILAILLMGIAGEMDYQDQMRIEAEAPNVELIGYQSHETEKER